MENVKIVTTIEIPRSRIEDLLGCAFEGGSNYWAETGVCQADMDSVGAEFPFEVPTRGGKVEVFDVEEGTKLGILDEQSIKRAFEYMSHGEDKNGKPCPYLKRHLETFLKEDEDSATGDMFLQMAVMGEIVFG